MEDEARDILRSALSREPTRKGNRTASIRARFAPLGGVDLPAVVREPMRAHRLSTITLFTVDTAKWRNATISLGGSQELLH